MPDQTRLTGITEHPTAEDKLHLCAINDVCSNRIVGYSMNAGVTVSALCSAFGVSMWFSPLRGLRHNA